MSDYMDYSVKIDEFEGPLDLLLHLIKEDNIDIYDISIDKITKDYLDYINKMEELNINVASSYLVMASELMEIKSKSLLPSNKKEEVSENEEEVSRERLISKLIEYKKYKEITNALREMYKNNGKVFFKLPETIELPKQKLEVEYKKEKISETYAEIIEKNASRLNRNAKNIEKIAITETYTVADKVKTMFRELLHHKKFVFNKLFSNKSCSKPEIVTAFTGLLELSRRSKVLTSQEELFGNITVEKKDKKIVNW